MTNMPATVEFISSSRRGLLSALRFVGSLAVALFASVSVVHAATQQTLTFLPPSPVSIGTSPITLTATASSGLTTFTFATSSPSYICTISGSQLNIGSPGVCQLTVIQAGNATYRAAAAGASITIINSQPGMSWIGVQSRKTHPFAGPRDISIDTTAPLAGDVSVEPRIGASEHRIVFQFNGPVNSVGTASATNLLSQSYAATPTILGSEVTVTLTGVPDGERVTVALNGVNGSLNQFASVGFLVGDANGSRAVNAADIAGLKANIGTSLSSRNFFHDVNVDGAIDAADRTEVKLRAGRVLPLVFPGGSVGPFVTSAAPPAKGYIGTAYDHLFTAASSGPVSWSLDSGTLPPGLTLAADGTLGGTPSTAGTYVFAVRAVNGTMPDAISPRYTIIIQSSPAPVDPTSVDINNNLIPQPVSKFAQQPGPAHIGTNGGGTTPGREIRGWWLNPSVCPLAEPSLTHVWYHNIDFFDYAGQNAIDYIDMAPNQAMVYGFVIPAMPQAASGSVYITSGPNGTPAATFVSISTTPCDFDVSKIATETPCYTTSSSENGFSFQITTATTQSCRLVPGVQYYLNLRFQDARPAPLGEPANDACVPAGGTTTCGALLKIKAP